MDNQALHDAVMKALGTVIEPELRKDLVTLNMIRDLSIEDGVARFTIMLTTPACPLKDMIYGAVRRVVARHPRMPQPAAAAA